MKLLLLLQLGFIGSAVSNPQPNIDEETKLWNAIGTFGHSLSQKLATLDARNNMLFSPFSVATAMSMALVGAKGATKQEMQNALGFQGFDDEAIERSFSSILSRKHENTTKPTDPYSTDYFTLLAANRLYASNKFAIQNNFKSNLEKNFHADAQSVDFIKNGQQIKNDINSFVEEKTKGLIKDVLKEPLSQNSILALINTLYFKGHWEKRMTEHQTLTAFNEGCGDLQSEHNKRLTTTSRFKYVDSAALQAQMIILPYISSENFRAEMLILLPKKEHNCKMQNWFSQVSWNAIKSELKKMTHESVALEMPAFELNGRYNLEEVLPTLGMSSAFTPGRANFTGISNHQLNIDSVIHQAKMIVTRFGTEAAAATIVAINRLAAYPSIEPIPMKINKSFYLSILYRDRQNDEALLPLFTAVVNKV